MEGAAGRPSIEENFDLERLRMSSKLLLSFSFSFYFFPGQIHVRIRATVAEFELKPEAKKKKKKRQKNLELIFVRFAKSDVKWSETPTTTPPKKLANFATFNFTQYLRYRTLETNGTYFFLFLFFFNDRHEKWPPRSVIYIIR